MDDEKDKSQKTEEATERRKEQALEKGQFALSKEISHWFILFAAVMTMVMLGPFIVTSYAKILRSFLLHASTLSLAPSLYIKQMAFELFYIFALPLFIFLIAALAAGGLQTRFRVSLEPLKPKFEKISLLGGAKRVLGSKAIVEFIKSLFKLILMSAVVYFSMRPFFEKAHTIIHFPLLELLPYLLLLLKKLFIAVLSVLFILATLDFLYQKFSYLKDLRMTKQEVKEEHKDTEGDPIVKGRLRQLRQERSKKRMMAAVPSATVVITNPTHYAVALKYEFGQMDAPVVVAKGIDHLALKIRELATEHGIHIRENPPLARALYDSVKVDQEIPPEHYQAVAEIIRYLLQLQKKNN